MIPRMYITAWAKTVPWPEMRQVEQDLMISRALVRTTKGPIGALINQLRTSMLWLGDATFEQSKVAPKLIFHADAEDGGPPLRLKVEINTRETIAFDGRAICILHNG